MAAQGSSHQYVANLQKHGASDELLKVISRINLTSSIRGAFPVYTLGHLAHLAKVPYRDADQAVVVHPKDNYKKFCIPKNSGGKRTILAPNPTLYSLQRTILERSIPQKLISGAAHGFVRKRDTLTAATQHIGAKSMITLDIKDFFSSITSRSVYSIFLENGYADLLSMQLTLLTTTGLTASKVDSTNGLGSRGIPYRLRGVGRLPQGAPTSGALSNVFMRAADYEFEHLASGFNGTYTRYADDLQFSFSNNLSNTAVGDVISKVREILGRQGLKLNREKIRIQRNAPSMRMLGLCVSDRGVRVDPKYRKRLLSFIYAVQKYGADSVAISNGKDSGLEVLASLEGHFLYVSHVDRVFKKEIEPTINRIVNQAKVR